MGWEADEEARGERRSEVYLPALSGTRQFNYT